MRGYGQFYWIFIWTSLPLRFHNCTSITNFPSLVQVAQSRECSFWLLLSIYVVVLNAWWHVTLLSWANLSYAVPKTWHAPFFWYGASQASGNALCLKEGPERFIDRYHQKLGLPWWLSIKSPPANAGDPGQEDPLEKGMAPHSSILAWRIPWKEEPGGPQFTGLQKVRPDWATGHTRTKS